MPTKRIHEADLQHRDPRWLELWRDAGMSEKILKCKSRADASTRRHFLYRLRLQMKKENHPWYSSAIKAKISLIQLHSSPDGSLGEVTWALALGPAENEETDKALEEAGYKLETPKLDI